MRVHFYGAAGEVTGSCSLLATSSAKVLVDCGLHQGGREEYARNFRELPFDPRTLDAVLLTHAHIDHCGRLPLLVKRGFAGPIYATEATCDLAEIMLRDSAKLQEADAFRINARRALNGEPPIEPLYTGEDAEKVFPLLRPVKYGGTTEAAPGVKVRWFDAGHMLGSASLHVTVTEEDRTRVVVFSGDIGHHGSAILRDPTPPPDADLVVMESTYGDRDHRTMEATVEEFTGIIKEAVWDRERVIVPSFAVGRAQQLIYHLHEMIHTEQVPRFPVFVDSPMASKAFEVYKKHSDLYDSESQDFARRDGHGVLAMEGLRLVESAEESKRLNGMFGSSVVIAPSGMCTGGRILHHLRHNVWRKGVHIMIVGFQAANTVGRRLVDGADTIRIMGSTVVVRAKVHTLNGFSAHAGQSELLNWARAIRPGPAGKPPAFVLNHGEDVPRKVLAGRLGNELKVGVSMPAWGESLPIL